MAQTEAGVSELSARSLARSAVHVNLLQVWQMASRLVLTPVVIAALGLDGYGVWVLLHSLCSYAAVVNTGIVWTYVKLTAELDERGEYAALSETVSSGAALAGALSMALLSALWLVRAWALPRLGVAAGALHDAEWTLAILSASALVDASLCWGLYVLAGLQRMDLQYRLITLASMIELAVTVSLLLAGLGLASLAVGVLSNRVFCAVAAWVLCRTRRPALHVSPLGVTLNGLRRLLAPGVGFQSVAVLATVTNESVRLAISAVFGSDALGTYQLANRLLWIAHSPAHALIAPLMPAFSKLIAAGQRERWRRLLRTSTQLVGFTAALPLAFAVVFADAILFAWTGAHFPDAVWTVRVLALGELAAALVAVAIAALRAAGSFGREIRYGAVAGVGLLAGFPAGAALGGYAGSVVAVAGARVLAALWFARGLPAEWGRASPYRVAGLLGPLAAVAPALCLAQALAAASGALAPHQASRWWTLFVVIVLAATSAAVSIAIAWVLYSSAARLRGRRAELR